MASSRKGPAWSVSSTADAVAMFQANLSILRNTMCPLTTASKVRVIVGEKNEREQL